MTACGNCGRLIENVAPDETSPTGYVHAISRRVCCFDVYKPEYATPVTQPERN